MYVLYKNPVQADTLAQVQYLHWLGHEHARPCQVVERNHPDWASQLPSVQDVGTGACHVGGAACSAYLEARFGVDDLASKAAAWKDAHPEYRISGSGRRTGGGWAEGGGNSSTAGADGQRM
jgi:hypothetical protein